MKLAPSNPWIKSTLIFLALLFVIFTLGLIAGLIYSYKIEKYADNQRFKTGHYPSELPNGQYKGSWMGKKTTWRGKEFNAASQSGINNFTDRQKYRFVTSRETSLGGEMEVLKIDYNIAGNPWWLRRIVDEVVEVEPGSYQGKVYVRYVPSVNFTITYFTLQK